MDNDIEETRFAERRSHFRGSARIHLQHFLFEGQFDTSSPVFLDQKNVTRLEKLFDIEGCLRLDPEHRIPVIISDVLLEERLLLARLKDSDLLTSSIPPTLPFPAESRLNCLHRRR